MAENQWAPGELITAQKLNETKAHIDEIEENINNAISGSDSTLSQRLNNIINVDSSLNNSPSAAKFAYDHILVTNGTKTTVPTNEEFEQLKASIVAAYDKTKNYKVNDYCYYNNHLYVCVQDHVNKLPPSPVYWKEVCIANELSQANTELAKTLIKRGFAASTTINGEVVYDFNNWTDSGIYTLKLSNSIDGKSYLNSPWADGKLTNHAILEVYNGQSTIIVQRVIHTSTHITYKRVGRFISNAWTYDAWTSDEKIEGGLLSSCDLNTIVTENCYLLSINETYDNAPWGTETPDGSSILQVWRAKSDSAYIYQILISRAYGYLGMWYRSTANGTAATPVWTAWRKMALEADFNGKGLGIVPITISENKKECDFNNITEKGIYLVPVVGSTVNAYNNAPTSYPFILYENQYRLYNNQYLLEVINYAAEGSIILQKLLDTSDKHIDFVRTGKKINNEWTYGAWFTMQDKLANFKTIDDYNIVNGCRTVTSAAVNGLSWVWNNNTSATVTGNINEGTTSSPVYSTRLIWSSENSLPIGLEKGKIYNFSISVNNQDSQNNNPPQPWVRTRFRYSDGTQAASSYKNEFMVPWNAVGAEIEIGYTNKSGSALSVNQILEVSITKVARENTRKLHNKYVAFGDSTTTGAIWSGDPEARQGGNKATAIQWARESYTVPYRIAAAIGAEDNYENLAIGGTGWINPGTKTDDNREGNPQLIDNHYLAVIERYAATHEGGFRDVSFVTISGFGNDGGYPLGNYDSDEYIPSEFQLDLEHGITIPYQPKMEDIEPTICGAVKHVINYFKTNWPHVRLCIFMLHPGGGTPNGEDDDPWTSAHGMAWTKKRLMQQISKICEQEHIQYISTESCNVMDNWYKNKYPDGTYFHKGYQAYSTVANWSHPTKEEEYAIWGDYVGAKIAGGACDYERYGEDVEVQTYTKRDLMSGKFGTLYQTSLSFDPIRSASVVISSHVTGDNVNGFHTDSKYGSLFLPVYQGDSVYIDTVGGWSRFENKDLIRIKTCPPVIRLSSNYLVKEYYYDASVEANTNNMHTFFRGTINIEEDGYLVINCQLVWDNYWRVSYKQKYQGAQDRFYCEVTSKKKNLIDKGRRVYAPLKSTTLQDQVEYSENGGNPLLKNGSHAAAITKWAVIGASYDSGEFNFRFPQLNDDGTIKYSEETGEPLLDTATVGEFDVYDHSCWSIFQRMNGIPTLYHYANGGQNARDWLVLNPNGTNSYEKTHNARARAYPAHPENPEYIEKLDYWGKQDSGNKTAGGNTYINARWGRPGVTGNGGCWYKLLEDFKNGKNYQAFVINLGSNDINNNYPRFIADDAINTYYSWTTATYKISDGTWHKGDTANAPELSGDDIPGGNGNKDMYVCGTVDDIGTSKITYTQLGDGTRTDVVLTETFPENGHYANPYGLNISHCYAGYMGAMVQRILGLYPKALILLCTIRNGFSQSPERFAIWEEYNNMLKTIAAMYPKNILIVDNGLYGPNYQVEPQKGYTMKTHPTALGYYNLAMYWNTLIDQVLFDNRNMKAVRQVMFNDLDIGYIP